VHVDRIYIETHRDRILVDDATLEAAKKFFESNGVQVAGGITFTVSEPNRFETFSYSNPGHRKDPSARFRFIMERAEDAEELDV
jgi:hypothetical protein